jgi:antitoxin (DNA-binding transcriptional repressor) of toxin-antitoxin stability system
VATIEAFGRPEVSREPASVVTAELDAHTIPGKLPAMKTATLQQLPLRWGDILRWVADGEEVRINDQERTVARVLPPESRIDRGLTIQSALDLAPLSLGRMLMPLTAETDLLDEMLDDARN